MPRKLRRIGHSRKAQRLALTQRQAQDPGVHMRRYSKKASRSLGAAALITMLMFLSELHEYIEFGAISYRSNSFSPEFSIFLLCGWFLATLVLGIATINALRVGEPSNSIHINIHRHKMRPPRKE